MKKFTLSIFAMLLFLSCKSDDETTSEVLEAVDHLNVSYGADPEQKLDIYLPEGRGSDTKVFVLVHGGSWVAGSRNDLNYFIPILKNQFPDHAIVNIDYRLATVASPGYPKQIEDIQSVIAHLKSEDYDISNEYAFIGASAGGHLSLLYAYHFDPDHEVKAVASAVGPTDFTDPSYTQNPAYATALYPLVGPVDYNENPDLYAEVSPRTHVSAQSPPTIMFYGGQDPLVPASQSVRLKNKLEDFGVYHEHYLYATGGHGNWDAVTMLDFQSKLMAFMEDRF